MSAPEWTPAWPGLSVIAEDLTPGERLGVCLVVVALVAVAAAWPRRPRGVVSARRAGR